MKLNACAICGAESETRLGVIRWKSDSPQFTSDPRCVDRTACRERVEAAGNDWPVADPRVAYSDKVVSA